MFAFPFLLLGLLAVAGPLIIHLLNRRRYRTIDWAAMDFLEAAIRRSKKVMELRDMLLLALRTLAILFFVLALAKPFFSRGDSTGRGPVHAAMVIDNSLSMGYLTTDGTLLELAKEKAEETIRLLPAGSRISVLPLCGPEEGQAAYVAPENALDALQRIQLSDRAGSAAAAAGRAKRACDEVADPAAKRAVLFTDLQSRDWRGGSLDKDLAGLELQVVRIGPERRNNAWIESFELVDGLADTETPAVFAATIAHEGRSPRAGVRVSFSVDGVESEDRLVQLEPGQRLQLLFEHRFDAAGTTAEPLFVPVELRMDADELPGDDSRSLVAPVVARMPVVFVDQYGDSGESERYGRYGETYTIRKLLDTGSRRLADTGGQLLAIRHVTIDELSKELLADARLVVVAGVESPGAASVALLRDYAEQGGQLLLAAGGAFDPVAWNSVAWENGAGILPLALDNDVSGMDGALLRLDPDSMGDAAFDLELTDAERLELLRSQAFLRYVGVDEDSLAKPVPLDAEPARWLAWSNPLARDLNAMDDAQRAAHNRAFILGRYSNGRPFAVRRNIGHGASVFVSTGLYPAWNNLMAGPGVLLLDGLLRFQLRTSLPDRTFAPLAELMLPIDASKQESDYSVTRPDGEATLLRPDLISASRFALRLPGLDQRGVYSIARQGADAEEPPLLLALNGPAGESQLESLSAAEFENEQTKVTPNVVLAGENVSVAGAAGKGRGLWRWLILFVLLCLLGEMLLLRENPRREEAA